MLLECEQSIKLQLEICTQFYFSLLFALRWAIVSLFRLQEKTLDAT
jgi:hypothetical protein